MGLTEIGVRFGFQGGAEGIQHMRGLHRAYTGLSSVVDSNTPRMMRHFDMMGNSVHNMSQRMTTGLRLAKLAITAFVAGKAFGGMAEWVKGNPEAQQWTDYLRYMQHPEAAIKSYEQHAKGLRKVLPGIEHADVSKGIFDIASKFGTGMDAVEANKSGLEAAIQLQKGLGPGTAIAEATNLIRKFLWSYGVGKSNEELLPMVQRFAAQIPMAISQSGAQGADLKVALGHLVGIYSQLGKPQESMIADMATLAGALGERTGELLRAVMSKTGEGFGKVGAALGQERFLAQLGARDEHDLPKELREMLKSSQAVTQARAQRFGVQLMDKSPAEYMKMLGGWFDELQALAKRRGTDVSKIINEAFGEGGMQGIPILTKAFQSGARPELEKMLKGLNPAAEWDKLLESQQSFDARYTIFKQKAEDLGRTIKKPFQAMAMEFMKPYGETLDQIESKWNQKTDIMEANARMAAQGMWEGFSAAFAGAPGLSAVVDRLMAAFNSADPSALRSIATDLGQLAGTSLASLTTGLSDIKAVVADIMPGLKDLAAAIKKIHEGYTWLRGWQEGQADRIDRLNAANPNIAPGKGAPEGNLITQAAPEASAVWNWLNDSIGSVIYRGGAGVPAGPQPVFVETKPQININWNPAFKEFIVDTVHEQIQAEYAAGRGGFGESWQ